MEASEKNVWNPDFDSNLTGIAEMQNLPKTRTSVLKMLDSPPAGECIKTLEAFR
jgi:hypothetical protein